MTRWTTADMPDQTGRRAVVTGANAGLGLHFARALAARGAHVVLACRNESKAAEAADEIRRQAPGAKLEVRRLDLADLSCVAAFAEEQLSEGGRLDLLVNNAGLMAIDRSRTVDGFETQLGVTSR
jgi:NAD(P)-dependent dehydrogenase (short-subunit alcohol dehydrogenase family)